MNRRRWGKLSKKLIDFFDKSLLQHFDFERFLIVRTIPFERKALQPITPESLNRKDSGVGVAMLSNVNQASPGDNKR